MLPTTLHEAARCVQMLRRNRGYMCNPVPVSTADGKDMHVRAGELAPRARKYGDRIAVRVCFQWRPFRSQPIACCRIDERFATEWIDTLIKYLRPLS